MSKFHVGDRVRMHTPDEQVWHKRVGEVIREPDESNSTYIVKLDSGTVLGALPHELRPADIFALETGDPVWLVKREGGDEAQVGDEIHVQQYVVGEAVDSVNLPAHYTRFPVEVINFTEQLDFNRGNAVKYIARAGFKEGVDELEDLSKAAWYVNRAIEKLKKEREDAE